MRNDALGFFWEDMPVVKEAKAPPPKRTPPERTWERPDYLPFLEEALAFNPPMLTVEDIITSGPDERFLFDVETFPNYFLVSFESLKTGKVISFERSPWMDFNPQDILWLMNNYCTVGFNSLNYDTTMVALACAGLNNAMLKAASDLLIKGEGDDEKGMRPYDVLKRFKAKSIKPNQIDLIEVAPLRASLKIYNGRLHGPRMQDLPFHESTHLTWEQSRIVRLYNVKGDLAATRRLWESLQPQIILRYEMSNEYGIDLRSKSDAQVAEAVIGEELTRIMGKRPRPPEIEPGTRYSYKLPHFIKFQSPLMNWALQQIVTADFIVAWHGAVVMPPELAELKLQMNGNAYQMGIGGLHSTETKRCTVADRTCKIKDVDVTSYYPRIILNQHLFPSHLGPDFLRVYGGIVQRRIEAKANGKLAKEAGDKVQMAYWENIAESLKITINGSFGKLGSKWSILYAPDLLIQTTITGQLCLLMLIERMELAGITVISANTDGVTMRVPNELQATYEAIVKQWERETDFQTEETEYLAMLSRDVNNYIAVKAPDKEGQIKLKTKGAFANPWQDNKKLEPWMHKNPSSQICMDAIEALLVKGVGMADTIYQCKDITKFVNVRTVSGGAVELVKREDNTVAENHYMGKAVRWYYAREREFFEMVYAKSGNMVPKSKGAKPCMDLPPEFPSDIDYDWYLEEAEGMLKDVGYL